MDSRFAFGVVAAERTFGGMNLTAVASDTREEMLAPRLTERPQSAAPAICVPRSARRAYSAGELQAAAVALAKLQRREDAGVLAALACDADADDPSVNHAVAHAVAHAVDRLLDLM